MQLCSSSVSVSHSAGTAIHWGAISTDILLAFLRILQLNKPKSSNGRLCICLSYDSFCPLALSLSVPFSCLRRYLVASVLPYNVPYNPFRCSTTSAASRECVDRTHSKNISNSNGYFRFVIELFSYSLVVHRTTASFTYDLYIYIYMNRAHFNLCNFVFNLKIMLFFCVSTAHVWWQNY